MEKYDFDKFRNDSLSMWYKGAISDDVTENIIDLAEADTKGSGLGKSRKKVSFLMAESFQNIVRHGLKDNQDEKKIPGAFGITNREGEIHIFSANHITSDQGVDIKEKLCNVNDLNPEELKEYYRRILADGKMSAKGGAGLGLIEMARKSGKPLQYRMKPFGDRVEFCMQIDRLIASENEVNTNMPIDENVAIHEYLDNKDVLLLFKGDFDRETTVNMVRMFSENADLEKSRRVNRAIFHAGVELLQNMSKHGNSEGGKNEGIFVMAIHDNEVVLTTRNFVHPEKQQAFEEHLEEINSKTKEELNQWYKSTLRETLMQDDPANNKLGLLEVAKRSSGNIRYAFETSLKGIEGILQVRIGLS